MNICKDCNTVKAETEFHLEPRLLSGRQPVCKVCSTARGRVWRQQHPRRTMVARAKKRSKEFGVPFDISKEDINIPDRCPILGIKLVQNKGNAKDNSPSLDRVVPDLGYIKGNIVVISHRANKIKSNATPSELMKVAKYYEVIK